MFNEMSNVMFCEEEQIINEEVYLKEDDQDEQDVCLDVEDDLEALAQENTINDLLNRLQMRIGMIEEDDNPENQDLHVLLSEIVTLLSEVM